jgi:hypothetical protein
MAGITVTGGAVDAVGEAVGLAVALAVGDSVGDGDAVVADGDAVGVGVELSQLMHEPFGWVKPPRVGTWGASLRPAGTDSRFLFRPSG